MTEVQSYLFDFERTPTFFERWNLDFKLLQMDGSTSNYQIVFSSYAPSNIGECLNSNGSLSSDVTVIASIDFPLKYDNGVITVGDDVSWTINTNIYPLKAVFIRDKATGYVMGYSININTFEVTNEVVIEEGTILWSIQDE